MIFLDPPPPSPKKGSWYQFNNIENSYEIRSYIYIKHFYVPMALKKKLGNKNMEILGWTSTPAYPLVTPLILNISRNGWLLMWTSYSIRPFVARLIMNWALTDFFFVVVEVLQLFFFFRNWEWRRIRWKAGPIQVQKGWICSLCGEAGSRPSMHGTGKAIPR